MTPAAPAARGGPLPLGPWILPLILLAGAAVYVGCLGDQLVWDDLGLLRSEALRDLQSPPRLLTEAFTALTDGELAGRYYRPVLALSLALGPARPRARAALGLLYVLHGRAGEGLRIFDALRAEGATDVSYYVNRAKAHVFLGEGAQANAVATEGLQRFPHRAELHEWLGRVLDGSGRPQEAIPHFREALALTSDQFLVEEALGLSLAKSGQPTQAVIHLLRAAEGLPDRVLPRRALAIILEAQGEREASLAWWREVLTLALSGPAAREAAMAVRRLEAAGGVR